MLRGQENMGFVLPTYPPACLRFTSVLIFGGELKFVGVC